MSVKLSAEQTELMNQYGSVHEMNEWILAHGEDGIFDYFIELQERSVDWQCHH